MLQYTLTTWRATTRNRSNILINQCHLLRLAWPTEREIIVTYYPTHSFTDVTTTNRKFTSNATKLDNTKEL
jgi:hypothetical protein